MGITRNMTIHLSVNELRQMVLEHLKAKGFSTVSANVNFIIERETCGYGIAEHDEIVFKGCDVRVNKETEKPIPHNYR
jgi:hypothetical protein